MKAQILLIGLGVILIGGCSKKEEAVEKLPVAEPDRVEVNVGESYDQVLKKLNKPNLESKTQHSLVLIYDKIEVKLENKVVVEVFDHRGE